MLEALKVQKYFLLCGWKSPLTGPRCSPRTGDCRKLHPSRTGGNILRKDVAKLDPEYISIIGDKRGWLADGPSLGLGGVCQINARPFYKF